MRGLLLGMALLAAPVSAQAADIVMAVGRSLPPYIIPESWSGLEFDLIREALALEGHTVQPHLMALARVVKELEAGLADAATTMRPESGVKACYSDSHITYRNYAISLDSSDLRIESVQDLSDKSVVAFQNATTNLGPEYRDAVSVNPQYREEANQVVQPLLLLLNRTQVVVADRYIFGWYANDPEVTSRVDTSQKLRYHAIFPPTEYRVAFRDKQLCEDFNRGLRKLRESGAYDRIIARYSRYLQSDALP